MSKSKQKCKQRVFIKGTNRAKRCKHKSRRDGYCLKHYRDYWNYSYVKVDGRVHGPMLRRDAQMATRRGGNVTKSQMIDFLKQARITK